MTATVTRDYAGGLEIIRSEAGAAPVLAGIAVPYGQWAEVDNPLEGRFLESIAPGAFARSIASRGPKIRALLEHGKDPTVGNRPLGPLTLEDTPDGLAYRIEALDVPYVRDLLPAVRAGLYGTSIRFRPTQVDRGRAGGLERRRVTEGELQELSLAAFAVYSGTTAGVRSEPGEGVTVAELDALLEALNAYLAQ